jgi:hypothetical protein
MTGDILMVVAVVPVLGVKTEQQVPAAAVAEEVQAKSTQLLAQLHTMLEEEVPHKVQELITAAVALVVEVAADHQEWITPVVVDPVHLVDRVLQSLHTWVVQELWVEKLPLGQVLQIIQHTFSERLVFL